VEGSEYDVRVDIVVNAVGTRANPLLTATALDLALNRWGNIVVDANGTTSIPGVFAGGDIVRGGATVILAMGDGKKAAAAIHDYLSGKKPENANDCGAERGKESQDPHGPL
jgi:glutamate synthase (NADPH/NADH) small chain